MIKAFKYRLYPNKETERKLHWTLTRCRELYNAGATSTSLLTLSEATNKEVCWSGLAFPQKADGYERSCQKKHLTVKELLGQCGRQRKALSFEAVC